MKNDIGFMVEIVCADLQVRKVLNMPEGLDPIAPLEYGFGFIALMMEYGLIKESVEQVADWVIKHEHTDAPPGAEKVLDRLREMQPGFVEQRQKEFHAMIVEVLNDAIQLVRSVKKRVKRDETEPPLH